MSVRGLNVRHVAQSPVRLLDSAASDGVNILWGWAAGISHERSGDLRGVEEDNGVG